MLACMPRYVVYVAIYKQFLCRCFEMFCARHQKQRQGFLQALCSDNCMRNLDVGSSLYLSCNKDRLELVQQFVDARAEINIFTCSQDNISMQLKTIIETLAATPDEKYADVAKLFNSATDKDCSREVDLQELKAFTDIVLDKLQEGGPSHAIGFLSSYGIKNSPIVVELFQSQHENKTKSMLHLQVLGTGMDPIFYLDADTYNTPCYQEQFDCIREQYLEYLQKTLTMFMALSPEEASDKANMIYEMESKVAAVHETPVEKRLGNCSVQPMHTLDDFLHSFCASYAEHAAPDCLTVMMDAEVAYPPGIVQLANVFADAAMDEIHLYLTWMAVQHFCKFALPAPYARLYSNFYSKAQRGQSKSNPCWYDVVIWQRDFMQDSICALFKERTPDNTKARQAMKESIQKLIETACEEVTMVDHWPGQTKDSKAKTAEHLKKIRVEVGYPQRMSMTKYDLKGNSTVSMMLEVGRKNAEATCTQVSLQPSQASWSMNPLLPNACYIGSTNTIIMTETMCLEPFRGQPAVFIAGHEISHSFDDQGMKAIKNLGVQTTLGFARLCSRMKQWSRKSDTATCAPDHTLTLGESIADLIGFRIALRHFQTGLQARESREPTDKELSGFYQQYAVMWGGDSSDVLKMTRMVKDAHPPPQERVDMATAPLPAALRGDAHTYS